MSDTTSSFFSGLYLFESFILFGFLVFIGLCASKWRKYQIEKKRKRETEEQEIQRQIEIQKSTCETLCEENPFICQTKLKINISGLTQEETKTILGIIHKEELPLNNPPTLEKRICTNDQRRIQWTRLPKYQLECNFGLLPQVTQNLILAELKKTNPQKYEKLKQRMFGQNK